MYRKLTPISSCLLCGEDKPLLKSHVVPNFFRRWLAKELGQAPRFQNPHTRIGRYHDDLSKHALCCANCEAIMSRDESVARKVMLEEWKLEGVRMRSYGPWLARLAAGMAAKAAGVLLHSSPTQKTVAELALPFNRLAQEALPVGERILLAEALETWRGFVLGGLPNPGRHELHLLGFDVDRYPGLRGLFGHNHLRDIDFSAILIYVNGIGFLALVRPNAEYVGRQTRIAVRHGFVGEQNFHISPLIADVLQRVSEANLETQQEERRVLEEKNRK